MQKKVKTLITMIQPSAEVKNVLAELEPFADIRFLQANESLSKYTEDLEVLYGNIDKENLASAKKLRWVQTNSTGIEQLMYPEFINSSIILTNTGRSITSVVASHAVTLFLALTRNLHHQRDLMKEHRWEIIVGRDIGGMTLGILGYGKIGREIAEKSRPFVRKLYVLDTTRNNESGIIDKAFTPDMLHPFLSECDAVICSLPLTPGSVNLISGKEFECMKNGSYLVNISRGEIVDEDALLKALRSGKLAGAGIDVLVKEPCPAESHLWDEPNLLMTPHSAGYCENLELRKMEQFVENFRHYINTGKIPLSLDKKQGW